jgi:putative hemolysin
MGISAYLATIVALTLANAFFAGAEIALLAVRTTRLRELASEGRGGAKAALKLRGRPEILLATVQIGITVVSVAAAVYGGVNLEQPIEEKLYGLGLGTLAGEVAVVIVVTFLSVLSIVVGELVPKSLALRYAGRVALFVAPPLLSVAWVARPVVWALTSLSNLILKPFGDRTQFSETRLSPEELHQLLEEAAAAKTIDPVAGDVAQRSLDAAGRMVTAIMVPRQAVVAFHREDSCDEIFQRLRTAPHTRYPVCIENGEIVGYVLAREIYQARLDGSLNLGELVRQLPFLPESTTILRALRILQRARTELAVVVDELGATLGVLSVEDIVEELVGEVLAEDEHPLERIRREGPGRYVVEGSLPVHEVSRALDVELPESPNWATIAGLMLAKLGHIPKRGERVTLDGVGEAEVLEASSKRIHWIRLRLEQEGT